MKDWMIRALKTFVQAFLGVLIPELAVLLRGGFPENWDKARAGLLTMVAASLAAAISAVWNLLLEQSRKE